MTTAPPPPCRHVLGAVAEACPARLMPLQLRNLGVPLPQGPLPLAPAWCLLLALSSRGVGGAASPACLSGPRTSARLPRSRSSLPGAHSLERGQLVWGPDMRMCRGSAAMLASGRPGGRGLEEPLGRRAGVRGAASAASAASAMVPAVA